MASLKSFVIVLVGLLIVTSRPLYAQKSGGGITPNAMQCGGTGNPCLPAATVTISGFPAGPYTAESGPFSYTVDVYNNGAAAGTYWTECLTAGQLTCPASGGTFNLAAGADTTFSILFSIRGIGAYKQTITAHAAILGGDQDVATGSASTPILSITGTNMLTRLTPLDGEHAPGGASFETIVGHLTSAIDSASIHHALDGVAVTTGVSSTAVPNGRKTIFVPTLANGAHTWASIGCNVAGRCDSLTTTVVSDAPTDWNLDDSLPEFAGSTGMGGVGPIALPPDSLRGCPMANNGIELKLNEPFTTVAGQGNGTAFVASYITTDNVLRISMVHIQNQDPTRICDNANDYPYIQPSAFNYGWWDTDYYPGYFANWPAAWGSYSLHETTADRLEEFAQVEVPRTHDDLLVHGPNVGTLDLWPAEAPRSGLLFSRLAAAITVSAPPTSGMAARESFLPFPGDVDTSSTRIVLNGTTIVNNGVSVYSGVVKVEGWLGGQTWTVPVTAAIVNNYIASKPDSEQGGWNELVVSIATGSGAKRSYERSRFVMGPPTLPADHAQVTAMRRFEHASTSDCPAFGALQCGSLFLTEGIPGFVSRDRDRSVALVYRSGSQRVPTLFPIRYYIDRYHAKPDTVQVRVTVDGVSQPTVYRYAGLVGAPYGINTPALEPGVTADRVLGVEIPAATSGDVAIRKVSVEVKSFYTGVGVKIDTVAANVVQLFTTGPSASRFGRGWSLSALQRLHHGLMWGTDNAKILATADGSFLVFRQTGSGPWRAPAGSTARLVYRTSADSGANWIVSLDDGTRMGFIDVGVVQSGRLAWTEDLIGNRTVYTWGSAANGTGADSLLTIKDPTGAFYRFTYGGGTSGSRVRSIWVAPASDTTKKVRVDSLGYDSSNRLTKVWRYRSATVADSTVYGYLGTDTTRTLVSSITDPRSKVSNVIDELVTWDSTSWTPSQLQTPVWTGTARYSTWFRDVWRRATPRATFGRTSGQGLERMITPDQLRGTFIDLRGPVDFRVDPFNGTSYVRRPPRNVSWAIPGCSMFCFSTSASDQIRDITRDTLGRVSKIVANRLLGPGVADSVMYLYDAVYNRQSAMIKPVAGFDAGQIATLDTITFRYDSAIVVKAGQGGLAPADSGRCNRLRVSKGVHNDSTIVTYGTPGVAQCLPTSVTEPGNLTSTMAYGPLTKGDKRTSRPTTVTGPDGLASNSWINGVTWSTDSALSGGITSRYFYGALGRPDSTRTGAGTSASNTAYRYDSQGRVTHTRSGWGPLAPASASFYGPSGLVESVRVYPANNDSLEQLLPGGKIQLTRYYYNRLGAVDSMFGPGPRGITADTLARKQSFRRVASGDAVQSFTGNGSYVTRVFDEQGLLTDQSLSQVSETAVSGDGERYRAPFTWPTGYLSPAGTWTHTGSAMMYGYDVNRQPIWNIAYDVFTHDTTLRVNRTFNAQGRLTDESRVFSGKLQAVRHIDYNRRGQRSMVTDAVGGLNGASVSGEVGGKQIFTYDNVTGRLLSVEARVTGTGYTDQPFARLTMAYDASGRPSQRAIQLYDNIFGSWAAGAISRERYRYSASTGRLLADSTTVYGDSVTASGVLKGLFQVADANYSSSGDDSLATTVIPMGGGASHIEHYYYSTDGTRRLTGSATYTGLGTGYTYDAFGNRRTEQAGDPCGRLNTSATDTVAPDNRLRARTWPVACSTTYLSDQAGNRLAELDYKDGALLPDRYQRMSYTALNQLYASASNTNDPLHYDFNWHFYDADGMRTKTQVQADVPGYNFTFGSANPTTYYIYDGSEVALTIVGQNGSFHVEKRFVSLGVDAAVAGRFPVSSGVRTLTLVTDHQGSTMGAVRADAINETNSDVYGRDPFGKLVGAPAGSSGSIGAGFAGGSTPNASGGFTYFRNRWYDPNTGRFLTQDPIGLAGGVNLYAYAGNNPVMFSDPFGLCKNARGEDIPCPDTDAVIRVLQAQAVPGFGTGNCGTFCRRALEAGGFDTGASDRPRSAGNWGPYFEGRGASKVSNENYVPQKGDIAVFAITPKHENGHVQIYDGKQWISDFKQPDFNPYRDKASAGAHTIYRFPAREPTQ